MSIPERHRTPSRLLTCAAIVVTMTAGCQPTPIAGDDAEARDATTRITGTLTDEGVECQALRTAGGELYTLAGYVDGYEPGDRVTVTGRIPEISFCMQGTTLTVESIEAASAR